MTEFSQSSKKVDSAQRYLCFSLGKEKFAIPLLHVKEVIGNVETTSVPHSSPDFKGIINLRGQVISIVDLRTRLRVEKIPPGPETAIIILDFESLSLGVIVDSVDFVTAYDPKDISAPPQMNSTARSEVVSGVAKGDHSLTLILDLQATLNTPEFHRSPSQLQRTA